MTVICTITSRSYHAGTAALINSLVKARFTGRIVVGYMDDLPTWAENARSTLADFKIEINFHKLLADKLAFYHKPDILHHCITEFQPNRLFFIDSDIVILKEWNFFETWAGHAIALCSDVNYLHMQSNHPHRHYWRQLLLEHGYNVFERIGYANGGFIGLDKDCFKVVDIWQHLIAIKSTERGVNSQTFALEHGFQTFDQDLLNAALMATDLPVSIVGHEGMSFNGALGYMVHAIGRKKPWKRGFLWDLIRNGRGLPLVARQFWRHSDGPIKVFHPITRKVAEVEMNITAALSRLIAR